MADQNVEVIRIVDIMNTNVDNSCQWCEMGVCEYCENNTDGASKKYDNKVLDEQIVVDVLDALKE